MNVHYRNRIHHRAFTLIELLIVIGIIVIISGVTVVSLVGRRNTGDLTNTASQIAILLRQAQNDSLSQKSGMSWGVHFENATATAPFYAFFSSTTYSASNVTGYYRLPNTVGYLTSTLSSGSSLNITFSQIAGTASASTSIGLYLISQPSSQSVISIASSGVVSY